MIKQESSVTEEAGRYVPKPDLLVTAPASQNGESTRGLGITLLILGGGALILPAIGLQFRILSMFGSATPLVGFGLLVVGGVLTATGFNARSGEEFPTAETAPRKGTRLEPAPPRPAPVEVELGNPWRSLAVVFGRIMVGIVALYAFLGVLTLLMGDRWRQ